MYLDYVMDRRREEGKESEIILEFEPEGQSGFKYQHQREATIEHKNMVGRGERNRMA